MSRLPQLRADVLTREVEDELLLYDAKNGETLLLNATAASILDLCDGERDAGAITKVIVEVVPGAEKSVVQADVQKTLAELQAKGFLEDAG
jgi:hypothetical protein